MEGMINYSRQLEFDATFRPTNMHRRTHVIVGCGGVGFWLGIMLAMQGYQKFFLIDGQKIEPTNLNRIPVSPSWDGVNKTIALRKVMRSVRPQTAIQTISKHVTEDNLDLLEKFIERGGEWLIWDCTDDARIQRKIFTWRKKYGETVQYRKIGYEGFDVGTYVNYDVWTVPDYQPGYRTSNACAATSALAAVVGYMAQGLNMKHDINLNVKEMLAVKPAKRVRTKKEVVYDPMIEQFNVLQPIDQSGEAF